MGALSRWVRAARSARQRLPEVVWLVTLALVTLALVVAIPHLVVVAVEGPWSPEHLGPGPAALLVVGFVTGSVLVLGVLAAIARRRPLAGVVVAIGLLAALRIAVVVAVDVPLRSDWRSYHLLALGTLRGAPPLADLPMGYPILLGLAYRLGGVSQAAGEALNVVASVVTGGFLAAWVWRWAGGTAATLAAGIVALVPSQGFFVATLGSETAFAAVVVLAALLVTEMLRAEVGGRRALALGLAIAAGLALGGATWLRSTGFVLLAAVAALPIVAGVPLRRAAVLATAVVLVGAVTLTPIVAANQALLGRTSASNSLYLGWQLYVGSNTTTGGGYAVGDAERVNQHVPGVLWARVARRYAAGDFDSRWLRLMAQRDDAALRLGLRRWRATIARWPVLLAVKFGRMWGRADNAAWWVFDSARTPASPLSPFGHLAAQVGWIAILTGAAAWLVLARRERPPPGLVVGGLVLPIAAGGLILEAQIRYHEPVVPLLAGLSGAAAVALAARPSREPAISGGGEAASRR